MGQCHSTGPVEGVGCRREFRSTTWSTVDVDRRLLGAPAPDRMRALTRTVRALEEAGIEAEDIAVRRPTLDEVFLSLTGAGHDSGGRGSADTEVAV